MSLEKHAVKGAAWTIGAGLLSRFLGLVGTLIITRYLAPDVMGEVVTAVVVAFMASWVTQLGINQYVLVKGAEDRDPAFHATIMGITLALLSLSIVTLAAPQIGTFLQAENLAIYLPGMALAVFLRRIGSVPEKILLYRMQFRTVAVSAAVGELAYIAAALLFVTAFKMGGEAIVLGNIIQAAVTTGIVIGKCGVSPWLEPVRLRWERFREILEFGLPLGAETFLYEAARYGDKPLFTKLFGLSRTGEYNLAYNLADLPAAFVGEQVSNVLLPMLLRVEAQRRKNVLVRAIGLLIIVTLPMAAGLAVVASTLVRVLLPENWHGVAPFLSILAAASVFRPINGLVSQYLISIERNQRLMGLEFMRVGILFGGIVLLGQIGPLAAALAVGLAAFAHTIGLLYTIHDDGAFLKRFVGVLRAPILACASMVLAVLGLRWLVTWPDGMPGVFVLFCEVLTGAIVYGFTGFAFGRETALEAVRLVRRAIAR